MGIPDGLLKLRRQIRSPYFEDAELSSFALLSYNFPNCMRCAQMKKAARKCITPNRRKSGSIYGEIKGGGKGIYGKPKGARAHMKNGSAQVYNP